MGLLTIVAPAEPRRAETVTSRGFGRYANLIDSYGAKVRVQQSSAASDDYVWIFIDGGNANRDYDAEKAANQGQDEYDPDRYVYTGAATHLCLNDAKAIRDSLTNWINDIEEQS